MKDLLREKISEILVKWNMSTRQNAIIELMRLFPDTSKVTRVEVIDDKNGRAYVNWKVGNKVQLSFQDENRTLKIFITNKK